MKRHFFVGALAGLAACGLALLSPTVISGRQLPDIVTVPEGEAVLGHVTLPRRVIANGEPLTAGDYEVHLTAQSAAPETVGALTILERWVEFRQGEIVRGREVVSIVPSSEIDDVAKTAGPAVGTSRVEVLRGNEYVRVWINQSGTHYLIHLVVANG